MKKFITIAATLFLIAIIGSLLLVNNTRNTGKDIFPDPPNKRSSFSPKASVEDIDSRNSFFFNILRDPASNTIPRNIRAKELDFASKNDVSYKTKRTGYTYSWSEVGPADVGGRTRAIGIDVRNSNIILAGGVSGGLYRSTNKGSSWTLVNNPDDYNGITWIAQDVRSGHQDTWYYVTGEFAGNSASAQGWSAFYFGNGIYKSTDNGLNWSLITGSESNSASWDSKYDFMSKVIVNPQTGSVYVCCNGYGIVKFSQGGVFSSAQLVLGNSNAYTWSDIDIHADGTIVAFLSQNNYSGGTQTKTPGLYVSNNDGVTFTPINSTTTLPSYYDRGVVRIAPSNSNIAYIFLVNDTTPYFYKIDLLNSVLTDRSANIIEYSAKTKEKLGEQGDYNMTLAIHPDNDNFVVVGSTSLFRSSDGFATTPAIDYTWIGGYGNPATASFMYPNHHPDCHITLFDPNNHNSVWSGHDGGLSYCSDITANSTSSSYLAWIDKNSGYNITQFYDIALNKEANSGVYMGGSQDNGTPYFNVDNGGTISSSQDISSGDGAYCAFTNDCILASSQNGFVNRYTYNSSTSSWEWTSVHPSAVPEGDKLFIHPFVMDKTDDRIMYFPAVNKMWYNTNIKEIDNNLDEGTTKNWNSYSVTDEGYIITALAVSANPAYTLYAGAYDNNGVPKIYKIDNANTASKTINNISIAAVPSGSYPHHISVNPQNGNELIVVFSNYNITGTYYSADGGTSFTAIEGNLTGSVSAPGPSIRSSAIVDYGGQKFYLLGTSTGLYRADDLNGSSTVWQKVESTKIGSVIVNDIEFNPLDGKVGIGTHGRGIFIGKTSSTLYVSNPISSYSYSLNEKQSVDVSLANVFGGSSSFTYSITSNSNSALLTPTLSGSTVNVAITQDLQQTGTIVVRATSGGNYVETSFSIKVGDLVVYVENPIPAVSYGVNEKESVDVSLANVFGGASSYTYSITSNSNTALLTPTISGSTLSVAITKDLEGTGAIVVRGTSGSSYAETTFNVTIGASSAIEEIPSANFTVYPNPTTGICYAKLTDINYSGMTISIIDTKGAVLRSIKVKEGNTMIDMTDYSKGLYFIKISGSNKQATRRVVLK